MKEVMMTSNIKNLNFEKGVIQILQVWKTRLKIKYKGKTEVIWTPSDLSRAKVHEIYFARIEPYKMNGEERKRMRCSIVRTVPIESIPITTKTKVKLLEKENGLVQLEIDEEKYLMKIIDIAIMKYKKVGSISELKKQGDRIEEDIEEISESDLFT